MKPPAPSAVRRSGRGVEGDPWRWVGRLRTANIDGELVAGVGDIVDVEREVAAAAAEAGVATVIVRVSAPSVTPRGGEAPRMTATVRHGGVQCAVRTGNACSLSRFVAARVGAGRVIVVEVWRKEAEMADSREAAEGAQHTLQLKLVEYLASCRPGSYFSLREMVGPDGTNKDVHQVMNALRVYVGRGVVNMTRDGKRRIFVVRRRLTPEEIEEVRRAPPPPAGAEGSDPDATTA